MRVMIVLSVDVLDSVTAAEFGSRVLGALSDLRLRLGGTSRVRLVGVRGITRPLTTTLEKEVARCLLSEEPR